MGDAERYADKLQRIFPDQKFTVCPKADALYPVVSAASIVAKVTRDRALEESAEEVYKVGRAGRRPRVKRARKAGMAVRLCVCGERERALAPPLSAKYCY